MAGCAMKRGGGVGMLVLQIGWWLDVVALNKWEMGGWDPAMSTNVIKPLEGARLDKY